MTDAQSRARKKYDLLNNKVSKSYKLNKDLVEEFADICKKKNISQASKINDFMKEFIEKERGGTK